MKTLATQRTLKALRDNGWSAHVVEKWIKIPNIPGGGKRIDAFGFGDILAMRPNVYEDAQCPECRGSGKLNTSDDRYSGLTCGICAGKGHKLLHSKFIALVQCCPGNSHQEHKEKILAIPEFEIWKKAGGRVFLVSWAQRGPRGERKRWTMREEEL